MANEITTLQDEKELTETIQIEDDTIIVTDEFQFTPKTKDGGIKSVHFKISPVGKDKMSHDVKSWNLSFPVTLFDNLVFDPQSKIGKYTKVGKLKFQIMKAGEKKAVPFASFIQPLSNGDKIVMTNDQGKQVELKISVAEDLQSLKIKVAEKN